ncbi:hypothetical protein MINS_32640 [Mycolicibacterium insubricum]|nr:hypothetical protein MINS_32640 [Mycolicibacterium insubricum]
MQPDDQEAVAGAGERFGAVGFDGRQPGLSSGGANPPGGQAFRLPSHALGDLRKQRENPGTAGNFSAVRSD